MDKYLTTTEVAQAVGLALPTIHLWARANRFGNQVDLNAVDDRMETLYALRPDLAARQPRWLIPSKDVGALKEALGAMYVRDTEGHKKHLKNRPKRIETREGGVFILPPPPGRG